MALTKVPSDLGKLSDEKLQELWEKTAAEALEARDNNKAVAAEVGRRETVANAQRTLDSLTDAERAALRSMMSPEGIESKEAFSG